MRIAFLLLAVLFGCAEPKRSHQERAAPRAQSVGAASSADAAPSSADAGARAAAAFKGTVRGVVRLAEGATLPLAPPPTMGGQPASSVPPCPPVDDSDQRTVARHAAGGLSPVHIAITGMRAAPPRSPQTHELTIDGCRLRPTVVGAMRGDRVRITNRTEAPLLPILPGDTFMKGLLRGESREFPVDRLGPLVLHCDFANYCGEARVITVSHPLYAVTDQKGEFRIEQVPLDQPLKLHAYHPLFEVTTASITLSESEPERVVELVLKPTRSADGQATPPAGTAEKGKVAPH